MKSFALKYTLERSLKLDAKHYLLCVRLNENFIFLILKFLEKAIDKKSLQVKKKNTIFRHTSHSQP